MAINVFVVDDHELVRRGLVDLISAEEDLDVVGQAGIIREALLNLEAISKTLPHVAVLDVRLPDGNGIDASNPAGGVHELTVQERLRLLAPC